jgi:hypothetical protein
VNDTFQNFHLVFHALFRFTIPSSFLNLFVPRSMLIDPGLAIGRVCLEVTDVSLSSEFGGEGNDLFGRM